MTNKFCVWTALALCAWVCVSCSKKEEPKEVIRPVRYQKVSKANAEQVRSFSGVASAGIESRLSFKVSGNIEKKLIKVGDAVKAGDLLAQIDAKDYMLQAEELDAQMAQTRAQERNAKANYDRVRALYENNNASKSDLDAARAQYESYTASYKALEKKKELAERQIDYTRLTAPRDGNIASVAVDINENVQAGQTIVVLTSDDVIDVNVMVPENYISRITKDSRVEVGFASVSNRSYEGVVKEIGVTSESYATTYPVTVEIVSADRQIRSGMAADVRFYVSASEQQDRYIISSFAVNEDARGKFVLVAVPAGEGLATVERREVKVGQLTDSGIEIFSGIKDGDLVITAGISKIIEGQKVKLL